MLRETLTYIHGSFHSAFSLVPVWMKILQQLECEMNDNDPHRLRSRNTEAPAGGALCGDGGTFRSWSLLEGGRSLEEGFAVV